MGGVGGNARIKEKSVALLWREDVDFERVIDVASREKGRVLEQVIGFIDNGRNL